MNRTKLIKDIQKWLTKTIEYYKSVPGGDMGTAWYPLGFDSNGNTLAIVCGWADGFEDEGTDWNKDGEWRLYMKFAFRVHNAIMSEYSIDWTMPYDKEIMEVDDTEIPISNNEKDIEWLLEAYDRYLEGRA